MNELTGLHFSPWTERARWALDWHRVPYRYREYTTLLGEPALRVRTGRLFGKVPVPLLVTPQHRLSDSFEVVRFADTPSERAPLLPEGRVAHIRRWVDDPELALCSARIRATRRLQHSAASLAERLPAWVPGALRTPMVPASWLGAEFIIRKYRLTPDDDDSLLANMAGFLEQVVKALSGRPIVYERFNAADIIIASMLQAVTPVDRVFIDLGPGGRRPLCDRRPAWSVPPLTVRAHATPPCRPGHGSGVHLRLSP